MRLQYVIVAIIALGLTACGGEEKSSPKPQKTEIKKDAEDGVGATENGDGPTIKGVITNGAGRTIFLEHWPIGSTSFQVIDKAVIGSDGSYTLKSGVEKLDIYNLRVEPTSAAQNESYANLIMQKGDVVTMNADADAMTKTFEVSGNDISENLENLFHTVYYPFDKGLDSLRRVEATLPQGDEQARGAVVAARSQMNEKFMALLKEIASTNENSPIGYLAYMRYLSAKISSQIDVEEEELDYFDQLVGAVKETMGASFLAVQAQSNARQIRSTVMQTSQAPVPLLNPGDEAPELAFPNPEGKMMKLSDLRGKVVMIDFWASWCGPCRKQSPHVVSLYKKYNPKGFEIFSVSLDKNKDRWIAAIKADGFTWPYHVSDLQQWNSEAAKLYGISSIPFVALVDKQGKIIQTFDGYTMDKLDSQLEQIFGF